VTPQQYLSANQSFGRPFVYELTTTRGFFSVVNVLLNAATYGLLEKRRLVVSEKNFDGMSWSDFFTFDWPTEQSEAEALDVDVFNSYARSKQKSWLPLRVPGACGSLRTIQRAVAKTIAMPRTPATRLDYPYAAIHVRRGDKTLGYMEGQQLVIEGEATALDIYLALLRQKGPLIKTLFILTDDYTAVEEFRAAAPEYNILTLCDPSERGFHQFSTRPPAAGDRRRSIRRLLQEVDIAARSSLFLGGFKSNVARYIALTHRSPACCFSVDQMRKWKPI
jgi:hypothetical protein